MKFETLNSGKLSSHKHLLVGSIAVFLVLVIALTFYSYAKYKNVQSIDLASGVINYQVPDFSIMALKLQAEEGKDSYTDATKIPETGYTINSEKSYCNVGGVKDTNASLYTNENGEHVIGGLQVGSKCYLYFDLKATSSAGDTIIGDITGKVEKVSFTGIATSSDTGIFKAPDDYGTSYYFRGLEGSLNNWVKFAGSYWRIIRINGNGTVRMIYSGAASGAVSNANRTGTTTQINGTTYRYNGTYNDNAYVGYMMGIPLVGDGSAQNTTSSNSTSYSQAHTNTYDSYAKKMVDSWYKTNIEDKGLSKYIDVNTGFCNDRQTMSGVHSSYGTLGYGTNNTSYAPWGRLYKNSAWLTTQTPTLQCSNKTRDLFTHTSANDGNKKLQYPVGMITSDEVVFAGGFGGTANSTYYLYTNQNYWTMSPFHYNNAYVSFVDSGGYINWSSVYAAYGLRPVINLKSDTKLSGKGSASEPYEVT